MHCSSSSAWHGRTLSPRRLLCRREHRPSWREGLLFRPERVCELSQPQDPDRRRKRLELPPPHRITIVKLSLCVGLPNLERRLWALPAGHDSHQEMHANGYDTELRRRSGRPRRDGLRHPRRECDANRRFSRSAPRTGEIALDLGCGPGYLTRELAMAVGPKGEACARPVSKSRAAKRCRCSR